MDSRTFRSLCLFALAGALTFFANEASAQIAFTKVADTTTAVPGQAGRFTDFSSAAISGGNVVFGGVYNNDESAGIYSGSTGVVGASRIADFSTTVPGQSGTFNNFGDRAVSGGSLVFRGYYGSGQQGIYSGAVGAAGATRLVDFSSVVPGQSATFTDLGVFLSMSGSTVAFAGSYSGGSGIYTAASGVPGASKLVDSSTVAPGKSVNFSSFGNPSVSGGTVAFYGFAAAGGLYTATVGGSGASRLADTSYDTPGKATRFTNFGNVSISGSKVAFVGYYSGGSGLFTAAVGGNPASLGVDTTTTVPGKGVAFTGITTLSLSGGALAFDASYSGGDGIFLKTPDGLTSILLRGDAFMGSTISEASIGSNGFDGTRITFHYDLANGLGGIAVADVSGLVSAVPEPSAWMLVAVSAAALRSYRRLRGPGYPLARRR